MNIFKKAKIAEKNNSHRRNCFFCNKLFEPDMRNLKRGWDIFCSKSCAKSHYYALTRMSDQDRIRELRDKKLKQIDI